MDGSDLWYWNKAGCSRCDCESWLDPLKPREFEPGDGVERIGPNVDDVMRMASRLDAKLLAANRTIEQQQARIEELDRERGSLPEDEGPVTTGQGLNDFERLRMDEGWPTPNHMRRAADALDMMMTARYGGVLRWMADACDLLNQNPPNPRRGPDD